MSNKSNSQNRLEHVYGHLRRALMTGVFEPGQKITVASLSSALGVSAMPVREALRRLSAEKALEMRPNRSVRVPRLSRDEILNLRELRELIEGHATKLATISISNTEIDELSQLRLAMAGARDRRDGKAILRLNEEFHFRIYNACGLQIIVDVIAMIWLHSAPTMNIMFRSPHFSRYPIDQQNRANNALIDALRKRDGESAASAVREEIRTGSVILSEIMESIHWDDEASEVAKPPSDHIRLLNEITRAVA